MCQAAGWRTHLASRRGPVPQIRTAEDTRAGLSDWL